MTAAKLVLIILFPISSAFAFTIDLIEVRGNDRTDIGTVLNYIPLKSGDEFFLEQDGARIIRALYETGLFDNIRLLHRGSVLVVELQERPIISSINIEGNENIEDNQLSEALKSEGIYRGRVFKPSVLETMQRELRNLYASRGRYSARIEATVEPLERNRVALDIVISEGAIATIKHINIVGARVFSEEHLLDLMESDTEAFHPFTSADEYSKVKLEADLEILRAHYLNRGYINFTIDSTQVSLSSNKRSIFITINITEGERYTISAVNLLGEFVFSEDSLMALLSLKAGGVFSRKTMLADRARIIDRLGEGSYAFANVNVLPEINEQDKTVALSYFIDPGQQVYVRRITFSGNAETSDYVFRREMRLIEGGRFVPKELERSQVRLQRLPFVVQVSIQTLRVSGSGDLVDINVNIEEGASGSFTAGLGFSSNGVVFNLGLSQQNFLGTGDRVDFNLERSPTVTQLGAVHSKSYYTIDGISRTMNAYIRENDASELSSTIDYSLDSYGFGVRYGVPLSELSSAGFGLELSQSVVLETTNTPDDINQFLAEKGKRFNVLNYDLSYTYDSRNRTVFPESGVLSRTYANIAVPGSELEYYKISARNEFYTALNEQLVFSTTFRVDYGNGYGDETELPFYERYYAGGIYSVRGFDQNSLGPKDSSGDVVGGDFRTLGSFRFIFPPNFGKKNQQTRISAFADFGNVFRDFDDFDESEIRISYGLSFIWLTPIGPLSFSYSKPYKIEQGDNLQAFQFTLGSAF